MKILTKTLSLLLLLSISFGVNAQISIGPKLGINIATLGGDDTDEAKSLLGFQAGITAEIGITEKFSFQPELLYFQKGYRDDDFFELDFALNYIEIPLLAKIHFGDSESTSFFATVGPSFGFGQKIKISGDGQSEKFDFDESGLKTFDLGLSIGFGVQLPLGPGNLFIDARYLLGLTSLDDSDDDLNIKNRGIGIAAGFLFPIGG